MGEIHIAPRLDGKPLSPLAPVHDNQPLQHGLMKKIDVIVPAMESFLFSHGCY